MSFIPTLVILGLAVVLVGFANYKSRQKPQPGQVRMVPYLGLQFLGILVVILMLAHLITLLTGKPFVGRMGL